MEYQKSNFLTETMNNFSYQLMGKMETGLEQLINNIQEETGFSRKCAIKYINTYLDIEFVLEEKDDKTFITLKPTWKPIDEVLTLLKDEDDNLECIKEII